MQKKKQPRPEKDGKEKIHSTDLPNRDNKSPENTSIDEDQLADKIEKDENEKHQEAVTWEPGSHPSQREH